MEARQNRGAALSPVLGAEGPDDKTEERPCFSRAWASVGTDWPQWGGD